MYEDIKTACLYVRFSSHNQTEQSIEGQTRVCQEFCQRHNIKIVEIYADRATSASKNTEKRVSFLKMIKDSEKGLFDAVVVYKLDRFARSRYDSATYKYRLKKNGVQLISATENITNSPEGIILESVLEGMAEFYSAELSQKINRGMRESAYKHNSIGGALPLGYKTVDKKLVIDEKTAPIVREAFTMYAEGHSVAEICRIFNARGYKTSKGTEFGKNSFSKIFRNERYIGTYTYHDYRAEDAIPAIIDRDLWDRVQLRLKKVKNSPGRNKAKRVYLLSGKLFCGHCGESMNGNCNGNKYAFYECYGKKSKYNGCQKRNLRKEYIERLVAQDALSLLTDENIEHLATVACERNDYEIETGSPIPVIRDRIHQTEVSINNLTKAIETGATPDALVKRMVELEREKKDLSAQLKKEEDLVVPLEKEQVIFWLEKFKDGDIEDEEFCRLLIDLFVNSVTVWDEDDDMLKVTIAYNLTSLPTKTYRLTKDGTLSDFTGNAPEMGVGQDDVHTLFHQTVIQLPEVYREHVCCHGDTGSHLELGVGLPAGEAGLRPHRVLRVAQGPLGVPAGNDGLLQAPSSVGINVDVPLGEAPLQCLDGLHLLPAGEHAALEFEVSEAILGLESLGLFHDGLRGEHLGIPQAEPGVVAVALIPVGQVGPGPGAVANIEKVAQEPHPVPLLAVGQQRTHGQPHELAQQIQHGHLHRALGLDHILEVADIQALDTLAVVTRFPAAATKGG